MANDTTNTHAGQQPTSLHPNLKQLDWLVGTWAMSGDVSGTVRCEWMDGGFFFIQHVNLQQYDGQHTKGMESIGHLQRYGEEPSPDIHSRYYSSTGETLDDVSTWTGIR